MIVLSYKAHNKLVDDITEEVAREKFNITNDKNIFIQYYHEKYEMYIDCEWENIASYVSTYTKFKIIECEQIDYKKDIEYNLNIESAYTLEPNDKGSVFNISDSSEIVQMVPTESVPLINSSALATSSSGVSTFKCASGLYGNLPTTYILPKIKKDSLLGRALDSKAFLSTKLKTDFLGKIHDSFAEKGDFFLGHRYREVANAVLKEYPHLGNNLPLESAKALWIKSLYSKFYRERTGDSAFNDSVIEAKKARKEKKMHMPQASSLGELYCIPNYQGQCDLNTEDHISVEGHRLWMSHEIKKTEKNMDAISKRMALTFHDRRKLIFETTEEGTPKYKIADDILQIYPCLCLESEAIKEVERLFSKDFSKDFDLSLKEFSKLLINSVTLSRSKNKDYISKLFGTSNSLIDDTYLSFQAAGCLAVLVLEDPREAIGDKRVKSGAPILFIEKDNSVGLLVDGQPFIKNVSAKYAVFLWIASFYFFNVVVPKEIKRTYEVLQYIIFKIPENPKFTQNAAKVLSIWNDAKKLQMK